MAADRILVAEIGAAHGLRGEVRLKCFTAAPMAIEGYGSLEDDEGRGFQIESARAAKGILIVRFAGVSSREAAERLTKRKLYIPRARLPKTDKDEFYHADLIGLAVIGTAGEKLGTLVAVHNFGAGDVIEVKPRTGPTVMLPFTQAVVPQVDIGGGRIVVDPPQGTFDMRDPQEKDSMPPVQDGD
jgi:16S rRNA processing protein RimM